jgi:hypothetical protein
LTYGLDTPALVAMPSGSGKPGESAETMGYAWSETSKLYWALKRSSVKFRKARWLIVGLRAQGWDWSECGRVLKDWAKTRAWVGIQAEPPPEWDHIEWAALAQQIVGPERA